MNLFKQIIFVLIVGLTSSVSYAASGERFVSVAFHDVSDDPSEAQGLTVSTDRLIAFFDYLRGDGWNPIGLDDLARARRGERPLPPKAILVSFDHGYQSLYSRVFPLVLTYRIPIVASLVGEWVDAPPGAEVPFQGQRANRDKFISWDQAREMQASGLVEFASASYAQHREVLANPQGNTMPALYAANYDPRSQVYESIESWRIRIREDFRRVNALLVRELGRAPRAIAWPDGHYSLEALSIARKEGYEFSLTLNDEPGNTSQPLEIGRAPPSGNLSLADWVTDLRFRNRLPALRRLVRVDPEDLWSDDTEEFNKRLGLVIERLRTLGVTDVIINAVHAQRSHGELTGWFPSSVLPIHTDALNRIAWQLHSRAGVRSIIDTRLALLRQRLSFEQIVQFHAELARMVPFDGLLFAWPTAGTPDGQHSIKPLAQHHVPSAIDHSDLDGPANLRHARRSLELMRLDGLHRLALASFRAAETFRPTLSLATLHQPGADSPPNLFQDLQLFAVVPDLLAIRELSAGMVKGGHFASSSARRRIGLLIESQGKLTASTLAPLFRAFQVAGGSAIGWSPDLFLENSPNADEAAPTVSSARFPSRY
jgi:peptidoglycan/xylan/chitin deacetylase (PgdA/CDA1 family)